MEELNGLWGVMTILGPLLLAAALIWAITHNRMSSRAKRDSERAVHDAHRRQEQEDARRDAGLTPQGDR